MAGFCALDILSRAYYTMERTLAPLLVNAAVLVCNWGLNQLLGSRLGGPGLALGTTISITLGGLVLAVLLLRRTGGVRVLPLVKRMSPVKCRLMSSIGTTWASPPPGSTPC